MNVYQPSRPILLPDRQERFCVLFVQGLTQTEAYKQAYSSTSDAVAAANSTRMLKRAKIIDRIDQIRGQEAAAQRVSLPFLTGLLLRAYDIGVRTNQGSAAAQAAMGVAKLHGFLIDRQQVDVLVRKPSSSPESPDEMSEEEWLALHGLPQVTASIEHEEPLPSIDQDESK